MTRQITSAYWRPPWLRKSVLFGFMATFIVFSAGLILMWYLVNRYDGIPLILTTNHYAWTYGPTAVLIVVVSLWRQVNYCILVNQPWQELYHGPQNAAKTVLLDYMWPLPITSFIAALRNGHLAVAASILIFTLLKLIMVISTTLFVLGNCSLSRDIQIRQLQKFDASRYFNSAGPGINITDTSGPVWDYLNLQEGYRDASPPLELSTAFTGYSTTSEIPGGASKVTAPVDIFRVNVTCEPATVGWSQNDPSALFNLTLYAPSCDIGEIEIDACSLESGRCDSTVKHFTLTWVGCIGQGEPDANLDFSTTTDEYRFAIITIESDLSPAPDPDSKSYTVRVRRVAVVSCNPEYSINQGVARGPASDTSQVDSLQVAEKSSRAIDDLSKLELLVLISNSLGTGNTITSEFSASLMSGSYFDLLGLLAGSRTITNTKLDPLLNASLL
ncbi:hypothetical protein F4824DRAFT_514717 [Ustulina deusta]|nr:hypothetical protein F4824DRAFT_514717 [Ustulina deusta]